MIRVEYRRGHDDGSHQGLSEHVSRVSLSLSLRTITITTICIIIIMMTAINIHISIAVTITTPEGGKQGQSWSCRGGAQVEGAPAVRPISLLTLRISEALPQA